MQIPEERLSSIREAIYAGASRKIKAVKLVREGTGCGLKEAKEFVEKAAAERQELRWRGAGRDAARGMRRCGV